MSRAPRVGPSDLDLVVGAIERYGSAAALARQMGVSPNTPNEWVRRLRRGGRLSLDKRQRLHGLADPGLTKRTSINARVRSSLEQYLAILDPDRWLRDTELRLLPARYRVRFRRRMIEERHRVMLEFDRRLREFIRLLVAESKANTEGKGRADA